MNGYNSTSGPPKKNRQDKNPNTSILKEIIRSEAWHALRGNAPQVYTMFLLERSWVKTGKKGIEKWKCDNENRIILPYRQAQKDYGYSVKKFKGCIDNLIKCGFLDIVEHGIAYNRVPTVYALSDRWRNFGKTNFVKAERQKGPCGYPSRYPKTEV